MPGAHCPTCAAYESRVMARAEGETLPADVVPCVAFAMSDAFREWLAAQLRRDILEQVKAQGLDRMALVKAKAKADAPTPASG